MMSQTPTNFVEEVDEFTLCPRCELPGGYMLRIPRGMWHRLFFLKKKRYLCQECGHRFYTNKPVKH
ncbi:MAG: Unknown protein [uncultured Thiotrichaceae bacterium]|uniref:Uncharacterized protein n=1 Tax=uncultured Thiotrichaceae bacterium TaxID=298394 RepID=A0A6S6SZR5_9GAMM|nr:MAG: Unknown protein [uncultured Thiotrichaceae bacterium]